MLDLEIELRHLIYIFLTSIVWTLMAFWGRYHFLQLYSPIPEIISTFIAVSFWIGGGIFALGLGLVLYTVFEN